MRSRKFILATAATLLLPASAHVSAQTWSASGGGDWNTPANWTPATVPNGTNDSANNVFVTLGNAISSDVTIAVSALSRVETLTLDSIRSYELIDSDLQFANATGRSLTLTAGNLGDHALSFDFSGIANFTVTNTSALGSITLGPLTGTGPSTITYSGIGRTSLFGTTGWTSGTTMALTAGANVSISDPAQIIGALTVATTSGFANISTIDARGSIVDLSSKTVTITSPSASNQRIRFTGTADLVLPATPAATSANTSLIYMNEGSGTVSLNGVVVGSGTNVTSQIFEAGKFTLGGITTNGTSVSNRVIVQGADVGFTGVVTNAGNGLGLGVRGGRLMADYRGNAATKFAGLTAGIQFAGGEWHFLGNDAAPVTETIAGQTRFGPATGSSDGGAVTISVTSGNNQDVTVNLGDLVRGNGSTVNFVTTNVGAGMATIGSTEANVNGIIGTWATYNGTTYATNNGADVLTGLTTFTRTDQIGSNNAETVTLDLANATAFTSGTAATAQGIRISNGGALNLGGRSFTSSILLSAEAGSGDTTISGVSASFSPGVVQQHNTSGKLIFDSAISGTLMKSGKGVLRLNQTSTSSAAMAFLEGTIELGADNALGTGSLALRDMDRTGGFVAVGGDRVIANSTTLSSIQNNGTFRAARFSGSNSITVTGTWQSTDSNLGPNYLRVDIGAGKSVKFGSPTNNTGVFVLGDTNTGLLVIEGGGAGDLRFFNPLQGSVSSGNGIVVIDRTSGLTIFDRSSAMSGFQIIEGTAVVKDPSSASALTPTSVAFSSGTNMLTVDLPTAALIKPGQFLANDVGVVPGTFVTAVDTETGVVTVTKNFTANFDTTIATGFLRPFGTTGTTAAHVESRGVLAVGADITIPAVSATSRGTLGINTTGYSQNINLATSGNGAMFLGAADVSGTENGSVTDGSITGGTLTPGSLATYRLGGGGGRLDILASGYLTGANNVVIGDADLFHGGTTVIALAATQDYTGATDVRAGTLIASGAMNGTSRVTVFSGATLGGSGSIAPSIGGGVTLLSGAILAPGDGVGTLTASLSGGAVFDVSGTASGDSGTFKFELGAVGSSDQLLTLGGALNIGTGVLEFGDFAFSTVSGFDTAGTYTLFNGDTPVVGNFGLGTNGIIAGQAFTLGFSDGGNDIVLVAIPEPTSALSLLAGLGVLLGVGRRRRARA